MPHSMSRDRIQPGGASEPDARASILLVDDDPDAIQLMGRILLDVGRLRFATNGSDALRLARDATPDLILLDAEMPGMSGFELLRKLKAEDSLADVPVIFITSHTEAGFEVSALDLGAADFIAKPLKTSRVMARVKTQLRLKGATDELRRTATTDALTGIANRRGFDQSIEREWLRTQRSGDPVSVLMIDVDHFKLYNDLYGHPRGDVCLQHVSRALLGVCKRRGDLVARYGGEEFVILLPQTPRRGAHHIAQDVLAAVSGECIHHEGSAAIHHVTVSVGIASYDDEGPCWISPSSRLRDDIKAHRGAAGLILAADRALYSAKHAGRAQAKYLDIADVDEPGDLGNLDFAYAKKRADPSSADVELTEG